MFLHLVTDEKFIDIAVELFNRVEPGCHQFVCITSGPQQRITYIGRTDCVRFISCDSQAFTDMLRSLPQYQAVFLHGLFSPFIRHMVNQSDKKNTFVWMFWGGELSCLSGYISSTLLPKTKWVYYKNTMLLQSRRNIRKYGMALLKGRVGLGNTPIIENNKLVWDDDFKKAVSRIRYVIPVISDDYDVLVKWTPFSGQMLEWNYPLDMHLDKISPNPTVGSNWLVGNSAHYSNNHLEMFQLLKKIKNHQGKVIVPLSYGDEQYRHAVLKAGRNDFGQRFMPLLEYMPSADYFDLITSCSAAFFNTVRQQAMGNVVTCLYVGINVFLRQESPVYRFMKRNQIPLYSIPTDIPQDMEKRCMPPSVEQLNITRNFIDQFASREAVEKKTRELIIRLSR